MSLGPTGERYTLADGAFDTVAIFLSMQSSHFDVVLMLGICVAFFLSKSQSLTRIKIQSALLDITPLFVKAILSNPSGNDK